MCGYVSYSQATINDKPDLFADYQVLMQQVGSFEAYPAFGGQTNRTVPLLLEENGKQKWVNAIWWFDAFVEENHTYLGALISFNARNLNSRFWKGALHNNRAVIIGSEIGESKIVGKSKHQYLMRGEQPFLLGALYRKLANGQYCCAVITREAHPKLAPYHDKGFPLFLPNDSGFLSDWLSPNIQSSDAIAALLEQPKLFVNLRVQRVKTYKNKQVIGQLNDVLVSDLLGTDTGKQTNSLLQKTLF